MKKKACYNHVEKKLEYGHVDQMPEFHIIPFNFKYSEDCLNDKAVFRNQKPGVNTLLTHNASSYGSSTL